MGESRTSGRHEAGRHASAYPMPGASGTFAQGPRAVNPAHHTRRRHRRRRQNVIALTIAMVLLLLASGGYVFYERGIAARKDFAGPGTGPGILITVKEGDSIATLAPTLVEKGIVASRHALMSAAEADGAGSRVTVGYYVLHQGMSGKDAVAALTSETSRCGVVNIPPGVTLEDFHIGTGDSVRQGVFSLVATASCASELGTNITAQSLEEAAGLTDLATLKVPSWAIAPVAAMGADPRRLEGLISAGTHVFNPTSSPVEILADLISDSAASYASHGLTDQHSTGLDAYSTLIGASIVEREAGSEYASQIARVIVNRINSGKKLEFDTTVYYGLNEQNVAITDEEWATATPWNTYTKAGLPSGPISTPSLTSLEAMENPTPGDWLYFVTIDSQGTTVFNSDYAEHEKAVAIAQQNGALDNPQAPHSN